VSFISLGLSDSSDHHRDFNYRLSPGGVLRRTFSNWATNLVPFTVVSFVIVLPTLVAKACVLLLPDGGRQMALVVVVNVLEPFAWFALAGVITYGVFQAIQDRRATLAENLRGGLAHAGHVFGASLLMYLAMVAGICACGVPGLYAMVAYWVVVPVAVLESRGAYDSLRRSQELTSGNLWRIFGVVLVVMTLTFSAAHLMKMLLGLFGLRPARDLHSRVSVLYQLASTFIMLPLTPLQAISQVLVYHDLRVGREGADVEELVKVFE
jgi:hypothetical protein